MTDGPLARYRAKVAEGALQPDTSQELAAEKLESLHRALQGYAPAAGVTAPLPRASRSPPAFGPHLPA